MINLIGQLGQLKSKIVQRFDKKIKINTSKHIYIY
jgi:hypothetical protein